MFRIFPLPFPYIVHTMCCLLLTFSIPVPCMFRTSSLVCPCIILTVSMPLPYICLAFSLTCSIPVPYLKGPQPEPVSTEQGFNTKGPHPKKVSVRKGPSMHGSQPERCQPELVIPLEKISTWTGPNINKQLQPKKNLSLARPQSEKGLSLHGSHPSIFQHGRV